MSLPASLLVSVTSPVTGDQTVNNVSSTLYYGTSGDFSSASVVLSGGAWTLLVYDGGPPIVFSQDTADPNDPTGGYSQVGGTGRAGITEA